MNRIQWETMGDDELVECLLFFLVQHGAVDFTRGGHHTLAAWNNAQKVLSSPSGPTPIPLILYLKT